MEDEDDGLEKYDTFFDYEEELADLKPSGEQYTEMIDSEPFVILEEIEEEELDSFAPIAMEECTEEVPSSLFIDNKYHKIGR